QGMSAGEHWRPRGVVGMAIAVAVAVGSAACGGDDSAAPPAEDAGPPPPPAADAGPRDAARPPPAAGFTADPAPSGAAIVLAGELEGDRLTVRVMGRELGAVFGLAYDVRWDASALEIDDPT